MLCGSRDAKQQQFCIALIPLTPLVQTGRDLVTNAKERLQQGLLSNSGLRVPVYLFRGSAGSNIGSLLASFSLALCLCCARAPDDQYAALKNECIFDRFGVFRWRRDVDRVASLRTWTTEEAERVDAA